MNVYEPSDAKFREGSDRSGVPRHADMAHSGSCFIEQALLDHLVIGKQGAVEEHHGSALQPGGEPLIYGRAAGNVKEGLLFGGIRDLEADGVALAPAVVPR